MPAILLPADRAPGPARPSLVRALVLPAAALAAVFMYVDRVCLAGVKSAVQADLALEPWQMDWALSGFFWTYALGQPLAGALAARVGPRAMLTGCLFLWSLFTALTGLAGGFATLLIARLLVGLTEAGAYPTLAGLVRNWFPPGRRGFASGSVALGGRFGGALGGRVTPPLVAALAGATLLAGWRAALVFFGLLGMAYAAAFWLLVRDRAKDHPLANAAEAALVPDAPPPTRAPVPWRALLASRNLWLFGGTQFGINLAWAFLVTHWPDYLETSHGLDADAKGYWGAWPLAVGMAGMLAGGFLTDALAARLGVRRGRALPIGAALFLAAAAAFAIGLGGGGVLQVVALLCVVTVCVDLGVPAVWAFAQDVGGRHVGAALGWGNMLGNVGAAVSPVLLGALRDAFGWDAVFLACGAALAAAGGCGLCLNATARLEG